MDNSNQPTRPVWPRIAPIAVPAIIIILYLTNRGTSGPIAPTPGGFLLLAILYFLPTIIALSRSPSPRRGLVFGINLVLGLTGLGWLAALGLAIFGSPPSPSDEAGDDADDQMECPHCAEWIKKKAQICRFCNREV